jgi:predicted RND superfamily exporter protein
VGAPDDHIACGAREGVMRGSSRFVDWVLRHGRLLWAVALLLAIPASLRTGWLYAHLRSELEELLPKQSPSVVALDELKERLGGHQYLGVVVDSGSREGLPAAEAFLDALAQRVRGYPAGMVSAVRTGNDVERAFLEEHGGLYVDLDDLRTLRARLEARRDYEVSRETGALLDDSEPPPSVDFDDIRARYEKKLSGKGSGARARYTSEDRHLSVLLLELGEYSSGAAAAGRLLDRVKVDVASLRATGQYPGSMQIGYAGDAAIATEELSALVTDLSFSSVIVVVAVMAAIVLYYRWWRSVLVVVPPLLLATAYAFGVASLPPLHVTAVNSNTAFLGSIIVGNGINFGLVLLSRYVEERRAGLDVRASLVHAVDGARAGTLAAAAAAGVSYAALAVTQFQGFRQFGFIGGLGMLFAWGAAFVLMPPLIAWLDTGEATRPRPLPDRGRFSFWIARAIARAPRAILLASVAASLVAAVQIAKFSAKDIESDFSHLRRRDTWTSGEGYWGRRMDSVLGEYLTPFVFLADRPEDARALARELRARMDQAPFAGRIDSVRTIDDVLPAHQDDKLLELAALREDLTPAVRAALTPGAREYVDRLDSGSLTKVALEDLPRAFTLGLRERDGTVDRVVLVYPSMSGAWWDANAMATFVEGLRSVARDAISKTTPQGRPPRLAGSIPLSSDIVQAIRSDGPVASAAAFIGVVLTVLFMLRSAKTSAYVIGALLVGVAWLAGASHLLGVRINFSNFIAFPITFGIGVDYAVNVVSRYEQDGSRDILGALRSTGAAVALCSLTTIIGYSSLVMAQNQALFLFGLLAVLGEIACLTVALASLPAFVLSRRHGVMVNPVASTDQHVTAEEPLGTTTGQ